MKCGPAGVGHILFGFEVSEDCVFPDFIGGKFVLLLKDGLQDF
jgi:hypothetical protein